MTTKDPCEHSVAHGRKLKSATSGIVLFTGIISIKATSPQRSNFIVHVQTSQETVENAVKLNIECEGYVVKFPSMSFATILSITMYKLMLNFNTQPPL